MTRFSLTNIIGRLFIKPQTMLTHMGNLRRHFFSLQRNFDDWSFEDCVKKLDVPILYICGTYDAVFLEDIEQMAEKSLKGEHYSCSNSAHYP